jgi:hypothetical protein
VVVHALRTCDENASDSGRERQVKRHEKSEALQSKEAEITSPYQGGTKPSNGSLALVQGWLLTCTNAIFCLQTFAFPRKIIKD